jgi:nucleoside-diphosphate-sugar epimerase
MTTVKNNELGFASVMLTASKLGIEQFIYASSSSVYGDNADLVKTEGNEGKPLSPYALSKKMNEEFARVWGQNLRTIGLRFFNVYGPGQRPDSSYAAVIPRFLCWDEVEIYGDGTQVRDFTYVDDVCEAIVKSLEYKGPSIVLNVGAGEMTTVNQLAELCRTAAQPKPQLTLSRPGDISFSVADTTLLEKTLGFKPQTKIAEGIIRTRHFYDSMRLEHGKEQQPDR